MAKIRVEIPLRNRNASGGEPDTTQVTLAAFQGTKTLYFEAVVYNSSGSTQYLYLKNAAETITYATLSVPNGTQITEYLSVQGTMFTSNQVDLKITGTVTSLRTARCIIVMDIGSDPLIHYPYYMFMGGYASTTSTTAVISSTPFFFKYASANYNNVDKAQFQVGVYLENLKTYGYVHLYRTTDFVNYNSIQTTSIGYEAINKMSSVINITSYGNNYFVLYISTGNSMYTTILYSAYGICIFSSTAAFSNYVLPQNQSNTSYTIADDSDVAVGISLTATKATTLNKIAVRMRAYGSPPDGVFLKLYSGNNPETGTLIGTSETIAGSNIPGTSTYPEYVIFNFLSSVSISASSSYCVIMERSQTDPLGSGYQWFITSQVGSELGYTFDGTTWTSGSMIPIILFAPDGIDKFEGQYMLGNQTAGIPVEYEADYWDSVTNTYYFSYDDQSTAGSMELRDGSNNTIANTPLTSSATTDQNITTTPFTMVVDQGIFKTYVTSGTLVGSRVIYISEILMGESISKVISAINNIAGTARRQIGKNVYSFVDVAGTIKRQITQTLIGSIDTSGSILKQVVQTLAGPIVVTSSLVKTKVILRVIQSIIHINSASNRTMIKTTLVNSKSSGVVSKWTDTQKIAQTETGTSVHKISSHMAAVLSKTITSAKRQTRKSLNEFIDLFISPSRSILKNVLAGIHAAGQFFRSIHKELTAAIIVAGAMILELIQGLIEKELVATTIKLSATASRQALKIMSEIIDVMASVPKFAQVTKTGFINISGSIRRQVSRYLFSAIDSVSAAIIQITKHLLISEKITATIDRIRVALKNLVAAVHTYESSRRVITRGITVMVRIAGTIRRSTILTFNASVTDAADLVKQTANRLTGAANVTAIIARMRVALKTLTTSFHTTGTVRRMTIKAISSFVDVTRSIRRIVEKVILYAVDALSVARKAIMREIRSDLAVIASTIKMTVRDFADIISAVATGFDAHKLIHTIYYVTITATTNTAGSVRRIFDRIISAFVSALGYRNAARSHSQATSRIVVLSTTGRSLALSIANQEGGPLTMAYTGDTIRLYGRFYNWAGALADVTGPAIDVYDGKGTLIVSGTPAKESTGVYYFEYLVPATFSDPIVYEMSGTLEGTTILARATIERRWV